MTDDHKKSGEWKIYLTMKSKFMSSTDSNEKRARYSKSDNNIVMIGNDTDEIIQDFFDLLLRKYQTGLEQSVKAINCFFLLCFRNVLYMQ